MITGPLKWYTVAEEIRSAVHAELTVKPARSGVVPGAIAWDACDCGLLAVSLARVYLSEEFPTPAQNPAGNCDAPFEVGEYVLQIIRCAPGQDGLNPPTVAELDASAQEVLRDAYEALKGVSVRLCEMEEARDIVDQMVGGLTSQGPSGQCVGNELRFFVGLRRN